MHPRRATPTLTFLALLLTALLTPFTFSQLAEAATAQSFTDGIHQVGTDITPGTYVADNPDGICTVRYTSGGDIQPRNPTFLTRAIITVTDQDTAVETINCGEWLPHTKTTPTAEQFTEGTYQVGVDIAPGIYTASENDGRCLWFNLQNFTHRTDPNQTLTWWKVGQPIVQLTPDDVGFYSIRCGTWQLRSTPTPDEPLTEFSDGSHLVNIDIASGTYVTDAGDEDCNWFRTAPFGDRIPDNTGGYASKGRQTITILPTDTGFHSQDCGTWQPLDETNSATEPSDIVGQGTFAVGIDIQPGAYVANAEEGRICTWFHLSGFAGRAADIISSGNGLFRGITEISPDTAGFRSIGCSEWSLIEHSQPDSASETFGDGEHLVNIHVTPGVYTSPGPPTGRCTWRRLSGFTDSPADQIAVRNPVGKNIAQIEETDAIFKSFGCGEWTRLGDSPRVTNFGRGTWAIDLEIDPGTYSANIPLGSTCFWSRLSSFSGRPEAFITSQSAVGHSVMTVRNYDAGFYSDGCGVWNAVAEFATIDESELLSVFDDGAYIVNHDILPGTFIAEGLENETCFWSRLTGFDGDDFNRYNIYASPGQAIATILPSDAGFRSFGCGTWRLISQENPRSPMSDTTPTRFADGTYRVGIDIVPGVYNVINGDLSTCRWRRLADFTWTGGVIVESLVSGIKLVEISEQDLGFASYGCGTWQLLHLDTVQTVNPHPTRFSSGSYVVGAHIAPGTYVANPRNNWGCRWRRVTGFGGESEDTIASGFADNRWIVTIDPSDIGFVAHGCGTWRSIDITLKLGPYDIFNDGTYAVNSDVLPGTYIANAPTEPFIGGIPTPTCKWQRVSGFGHAESDQIETGSGKGRIEVTIDESDAGFVSSGCGQWQRSD